MTTLAPTAGKPALSLTLPLSALEQLHVKITAWSCSAETEPSVNLSELIATNERLCRELKSTRLRLAAAYEQRTVAPREVAPASFLAARAEAERTFAEFWAEAERRKLEGIKEEV